MKVKELINALTEMPQEIDVFVQLTDDEDVEITQVIYNAEGKEVILETL